MKAVSVTVKAAGDQLPKQDSAKLGLLLRLHNYHGAVVVLTNKAKRESRSPCEPNLFRLPLCCHLKTQDENFLHSRPYLSHDFSAASF